MDEIERDDETRLDVDRLLDEAIANASESVLNAKDAGSAAFSQWYKHEMIKTKRYLDEKRRGVEPTCRNCNGTGKEPKRQEFLEVLDALRDKE